MNNPSFVCEDTVAFGPSTPLAETYADCRRIARAINPQWGCLADDEISISELTGGTTNVLFLLTRAGLRKLDATDSASTVDLTINPSKLVMRIFGKGTEALIDRQLENAIFAALSSSHSGCPTFYGLFSNGRIEGYLPFQSITVDAMVDPKISSCIAAGLCDLHFQSIPDISHDAFVWQKVEKFFSQSEAVAFPSDPEKQRKLDHISLSKMRATYDTLKADVLSSQLESTTASNGLSKWSIEDGSQAYRLGLLFGFSSVLCHNDLHAGNILLQDDNTCSGDGHQQEVKFIDFEYAAYNYRAHDIANHFCEYAGFSCEYARCYPMLGTRFYFYRAYLDKFLQSNDIPALGFDRLIKTKLITLHDAIPDTFLRGLDDAVLKLTSVVQIMWGSWAVVQSSISHIDFDYLSYAKMRFNGHFDHIARLEELRSHPSLLVSSSLQTGNP